MGSGAVVSGERPGPVRRDRAGGERADVLQHAQRLPGHVRALQPAGLAGNRLPLTQPTKSDLTFGITPGTPLSSLCCADLCMTESEHSEACLLSEARCQQRTSRGEERRVPPRCAARTLTTCQRCLPR